MVGNEGRLGESPQRLRRAERHAQRMATLAAAHTFGALGNEADRAREAAVGLGDDPFLAPAGDIIGLRPPNGGFNPFAVPFQPLLAPGVDADAQQPAMARLSGSLPGGVALNLKRPTTSAVSTAAADGEKERVRPGADAGGGQGNNAGREDFIGSAMRRVVFLGPKRGAQEGQPLATNEGNAPRCSVSLKGILRPLARDTPTDEESNGNDVFQVGAGIGDALTHGPQLFKHDALARQCRLSNGAAAAIGARPPQMQRGVSGDGSNDGHQGSLQNLPAQRPPFRPPIWRSHSERPNANDAQPALPVPVQVPDGAAVLAQWRADDSGESSDHSIVAQPGGRPARQAPVDDENETEHLDPALSFPSSPLERLNPGMRRASIEHGEDADGAAPQQAPSGDVEMGEDNENDFEEGGLEEEL